MRFLLIAFLLVLTGCGNTAGESSGRPDPTSTSAALVGACEPDAAALSAAKEIGVADLGSGRVPVALTGPGTRCPNMIFTRAPDGTAYVELGYEPTATRVIRVGGADLVAVRQGHARGGFQEHLYAARGDALREITRPGNPLLPFVALDTPGQPHAFVDCNRDGLRVLDIEPTGPGGVVMAWDVFATTYTVSGGEVSSSPRARTAHSVPDSKVETAQPELFRVAWFKHCR